MSRAIDFYDIDEYKDLLREAEQLAQPGFETDFVSSLIEKHQQYGAQMYLSAKQADILSRIASGVRSRR